MNHWPINISGPCRPNLSRIDGSQHQWVEPRPSPETALEGSLFGCLSLAEQDSPERPVWVSGSRHEGSGTPVRLGGVQAPSLGRFGSTPCRASTDGSTIEVVTPFSASAPVATMSPTTHPTATGTCAASLPGVTSLPRRRNSRRSWFAIGSMCRVSRSGLPRSSQPSGCWSVRPKRLPGSVCPESASSRWSFVRPPQVSRPS
jgi:hypothetical protein